MPDVVFGPLLSFTDIEQRILAHYKLWMHTWLAARERARSMPVGSIARPRSYRIKQTFTALPGEERTPMIICVSDGFATEPTRRARGEHDALFRFGIAAVCYGNNGVARTLAGHYQTALLGIALRHRVIDNGLIDFWDFNDLRIEDIEEEALGRSMAAVRLEVVYRVQSFANEFPALALEQPPIDPEEPQPDLTSVETVTVDVENYRVDEDFETPPAPGVGEPLESDTVLDSDTVLVSDGIEVE